MMAVSEAAIQVQEFWKNIFPRTQAEDQILFHFKKTSFRGISYKDLNAQAHCTAAWLMQKGLRKGGYVGVLAHSGPANLLLDVALQFLGAVQITLGPEIETVEITRIAREKSIEFIFAPDFQSLQKHNQFREMKPQLKALILHSEEVDGLDPEKLVTLDRVVTHGKAAWRENVQQLDAMKSAVLPHDPYCLKDGEDMLSFQDLLNACGHAQKILSQTEALPVLNLLSSEHLLQRSVSFTALALRRKIYLCTPEKIGAETFQLIQPGHLLMTPDDLKAQYDNLPELLGNESSSRKQLDKAKEIVQKRDEAASQGKKNPFFNRIKYRLNNQKLYAKIRSRLGNQLHKILLSDGPLDADVKAFYEECELSVNEGKP